MGEGIDAAKKQQDLQDDSVRGAECKLHECLSHVFQHCKYEEIDLIIKRIHAHLAEASDEKRQRIEKFI